MRPSAFNKARRPSGELVVLEPKNTAVVGSRSTSEETNLRRISALAAEAPMVEKIERNSASPPPKAELSASILFMPKSVIAVANVVLPDAENPIPQRSERI
jgi:hypothetical protein